LIKTHLLFSLFSAASVLFTLDYNGKAEESDADQTSERLWSNEWGLWSNERGLWSNEQAFVVKQEKTLL